MKNKEEIIKEIETLQLELNKIEDLEKEYQSYIGKYYTYKFFKGNDFCFIYFKVLEFWKFNGEISLFKVLEVDENSIFINTYRLEDLKTEITKEEFLIEFSETFKRLNELI